MNQYNHTILPIIIITQAGYVIGAPETETEVDERTFKNIKKYNMTQYTLNFKYFFVGLATVL